MNWRRVAVYGTCFALVTVWMGQSQVLDEYIHTLKQSQSTSALQRTAGSMHQPEDAALLAKIKEEAEKRRVPAVDARSDRIWGLIPGYNGLEVDIDRTYKLVKEKGTFDTNTIVWHEVEPKVQLSDLQPREIRQGNPDKPMVSMMINVAWGDEYLLDMLDTLKRNNVRTTFFFDGSWLSKHLDIAKRIQDEGHELANHAYSHKNMSTLSRSAAIQEMQKTQDLLLQLGVQNNLFAPPSGDFNQETVKQAAELNMRTILWTLDTIDWKNPGKDQILAKIQSRVRAGTLILMHPTASSRDALEGMIRIIRNKGLTIGTVTEVLSPNRVAESGKTTER